LYWDFFLEIGNNIFLEIEKNGLYLALGMGPSSGPVRLAEKALKVSRHRVGSRDGGGGGSWVCLNTILGHQYLIFMRILVRMLETIT
jgi:hypothetical protein